MKSLQEKVCDSKETQFPDNNKLIDSEVDETDARGETESSDASQSRRGLLQNASGRSEGETRRIPNLLKSGNR